MFRVCYSQIEWAGRTVPASHGQKTAVALCAIFPSCASASFMLYSVYREAGGHNARGKKTGASRLRVRHRVSSAKG